jgi:antitoxin HicB
MMAKRRNWDVNAYAFHVRRLPEEEGGGYLVEYPDIPNCIADGKTVEEAVRHGLQALEACLSTLAEFQKPIPKPDWKASSGQWRQRVPRSLHARLVERAEREGVSLNTLVTALIAEGMGRRETPRR